MHTAEAMPQDVHEGSQLRGSGAHFLNEAFDKALDGALNHLSLGDQFFDVVCRAAKNSGCAFLFEVPAAMLWRGKIGEECERVAALACETDGREEIFFVAFSENNRAIRVIDGADAPADLLSLVHSYAGVLLYFNNTAREHLTLQ